jgi:hypothetical protein
LLQKKAYLATPPGGADVQREGRAARGLFGIPVMTTQLIAYLEHASAA